MMWGLNSWGTFFDSYIDLKLFLSEIVTNMFMNFLCFELQAHLFSIVQFHYKQIRKKLRIEFGTKQFVFKENHGILQQWKT